jgi:hypothetical protein
MSRESETIQPIPMEESYGIPSKNLFRDIAGIIAAPRETFDRILKIGYWGGVFLCILIVAGILQQIYHPVLIDYNIEQMQERAAQSGQDLQGALGFFGNPAITRPLYLFTTLAGHAVFILISTILYFFIGSIIFGGTAKFKPVWIVACWAYVIEIIGLIIKTPLILIKHSMEAGLNFGLIFSEEMAGPKLHKLMGLIDIFGIWHLFVAGIGLAILYKFSAGKGIAISFIAWLIVIGVSGAFILIS